MSATFVIIAVVVNGSSSPPSFTGLLHPGVWNSPGSKGIVWKQSWSSSISYLTCSVLPWLGKNNYWTLTSVICAVTWNRTSVFLFKKCSEILFIFMSVCVKWCLCTKCGSACRAQKKVLDHLELEFQKIVSCHIGVGSWTLVLLKSSQYS